jgi:hypothetical protein
MKMLLTLVAAVAVTGAVPATAVTVYDAFTTFNGTQGAGNFTYGASDSAFVNGALFASNSNCFIAGSICLQAASNFDVPGVTKSATTSFQYNSVNVPDDRLLLHPGPNANDSNVFVQFTAPTAGYYRIDGMFNLLDNSPTGVDVYFGMTSNQGLVGFGGSALNSGNTSYAYTGQRFLNQGDAVLAIVNRSGNYGSDSTGLNFTLTAGVPEPANWALLIAGFGLTGAAMRRRRTLAAA